LKNARLEYQEKDGKITLRLILGKQVMKIGDGRNWLRIVSNGGFCVIGVETSGSAKDTLFFPTREIYCRLSII
jgi:hypothetical protein